MRYQRPAGASRHAERPCGTSPLSLGGRLLRLVGRAPAFGRRRRRGRGFLLFFLLFLLLLLRELSLALLECVVRLGHYASILMFMAVRPSGRFSTSNSTRCEALSFFTPREMIE